MFSDLLSPAQIVGYVAFLATAVAFLIHDDRRMKATLTAGAVVWALHYRLLEADTAAALSVLIALRQAVSIAAPKMASTTRHLLAAGFIVAFTLGAALTWQGWVSLLPWLAAVNATYALFYLAGIRMRVQLLASDTSWLVNGIWFGSVGQIVASLLALAVNSVTIGRMRRMRGR